MAWEAAVGNTEEAIPTCDDLACAQIICCTGTMSQGRSYPACLKRFQSDMEFNRKG
jgi:hypothetical protein